MQSKNATKRKAGNIPRDHVFWIGLLRVIVPGVILGVIIGKVVAENPRYIELFRLRFWVSSAKEADKRRWMRFISLAVIFAGLAFFLVGYVSNIVASRWMLYSKEEYVFVKIARISLPLLFASVTLLPILEEWIFRGILLEEIARRWKSRWWALAISSVIFAIFHLSNPGTFPAAVIPLTFGGLILGGSYLAGGLATAILCHSLYNVILILPMIS